MTVHHGDCIDVMRGMDADSVDAIVTDPPYGLSFMGKEWDHGVPGEPFWREALRVAKPGAHLVAFGGTRTYHRLAVAIEDAGWEIRDCLSWLYGSGFPKSLDVSKAMDKAAGAEREVVGRKWESRGGGGLQRSIVNDDNWTPPMVTDAITAPATDLAREWAGWGTALKPAWEPIILARKPLIGTVAANVTAYGTGGLNVDGCRIGTAGGPTRGPAERRPGVTFDVGGDIATLDAGRWPANVCLDEAAAAMLDAQSGERTSGVPGTRRKGHETSAMRGRLGMTGEREVGYGDTGGASRFFYCAKASRSEREAGLEDVTPKRSGVEVFDPKNRDGVGEERMTLSKNHHPTVKPLSLMRWLCRLVTPKDGLILDPFTGSGTTGCAAVLEGFRFVGAEREAEYVAIAEKRIAHWTPIQPDLVA